MTSRELAATVLIESWYNAGFLDDLDRALARFLKDSAPQTHHTVLVLAALVSRQLRLGHSCLPLQNTLPEGFESAVMDTDALSPAQWWHTVSHEQKQQALAEDRISVSTLSTDNTPLVVQNDLLYLRRAFQAEQQVTDALTQKLALTFEVPEHNRERLNTLFTATNPSAEQAPHDWQKIACALALRSGFTLITGGPGTGKTTTVVKLLALLQWNALDESRKLRIRLAAPTGKAAARLKGSISQAIDALPVTETVRASIPREVFTLHKLLGSRPASRHFMHHADNPLHADVVVVDEASMLDLEMAAALLTALPAHCRLILLGDKDQLASVEAGAVMGDLCSQADPYRYDQATLNYLAHLADETLAPASHSGSALGQQTAMLRHSHRFAANSGIGQLARAINHGDNQAASLLDGSYPDIQRLSYHPSSPLRRLVVEGYRHFLTHLTPPENPAEIEPWIRRTLQAHQHFQVLCAVREGEQGVAGLNTQIAQWLFEEQLISRTDGWYAGRPVMITRNDYATGLMNGDTGLALNIPDLASGQPQQSRLRVAFLMPDNSIRQLLPSRLENVETVYAMTVHKSQGSEFKQVLMVLPTHNTQVLTRELVYTAITRARERFTLCTDNTQLDTFARTRRHSGLAHLLP